MTNICSILAYDEICNSGYVSKRQAMFLSIIVNSNTQMSARDIAQEIERKFGEGFSKNGIGSRLSELERKDFIKKEGIKKDPFTNKFVNCWVYTGNKKPKKQPQQQSCICTKCKGSGIIWR